MKGRLLTRGSGSCSMTTRSRLRARRKCSAPRLIYSSTSFDHYLRKKCNCDSEEDGRSETRSSRIRESAMHHMASETVAFAGTRAGHKHLGTSVNIHSGYYPVKHRIVVLQEYRTMLPPHETPLVACASKESALDIPNRSPLPAFALKAGIAIELVAETPSMDWLECRRRNAECFVQFVDQVFHPLASAYNESGAVSVRGRVRLAEPSDGEGSCCHMRERTLATGHADLPFVWQSSFKKGGSQTMRSALPLRSAADTRRVNDHDSSGAVVPAYLAASTVADSRRRRTRERLRTDCRVPGGSAWELARWRLSCSVVSQRLGTTGPWARP